MIGWPEAVGRLAGERRKAKACAALLKGYGDQQQSSRGQLAYGETKANFDAVIAELITALTEGGSPKSLPSLETDLQHGATSLGKFCQTVSDLLPSASGRKDVVADIVGRAVEPMIYAFRNHGAFTQVLLDALGKDALGKGVGLISMSDLTRYVSTHVISLTGGQRHPDLEQRGGGELFIAGQ